MKFLSLLILAAMCVAMATACKPAIGDGKFCPLACKLDDKSDMCKAACAVWPNMLNCPTTTAAPTTTTTAAPAATG